VIEVLVCVLIAACFGQLVKTRKNHKNNLVQKMFKTILTLWRLGGFGDFRKKTEVFGCLTNALAPPPIAPESCSMAQTDRPV